jgi:hypothetical protein
MLRRSRPINRTQALVLVFLGAAWCVLIASFVGAPAVVEETLKLPNGGRTPAGYTFLAAVTALVGFMSLGTIWRWRWLFWLILLAFGAGVLRVPVALLQLTGVLALTAPAWYTTLQALIGTAQFLIALAMLRGYRNSGTWGSF